MSASNSIIIAFIRNVKSVINDDHLLIRESNHQNLYNVEYRDSLNQICNKSLSTEGEIADIIDNFLNLLPVDTDPFSHVQLTAPSFPPVLLTVSSLTSPDIRDALHNVVHRTIRNWPSATKITRPVTRSQTRALTSTA